MGIFSTAKPCINCGNETTSVNGHEEPFCDSCALQKKIKNKLKKEVTRTCCACQTQMTKVTYPDLKTLLEIGDEKFVIIDKCPKCRSIFLDNGELKKISTMIEEKGISGSGLGFSTGLLLGIAIG